MSEYQPNPLFAGKTGSATVGKMTKVSWQGGSRPESEFLHFEPRVTPAHRTKAPYLVLCNGNHLIASTGLCPFREWCCLCLLQPLTPRVLLLPPWFPRLPFSHMGKVSYPYLSAVAFNMLFVWFFFFQSELIQRCLLIAMGVHPHPT